MIRPKLSGELQPFRSRSRADSPRAQRVDLMRNEQSGVVIVVDDEHDLAGQESAQTLHHGFEARQCRRGET